jgi:hypothetical protein
MKHSSARTTEAGTRTEGRLVLSDVVPRTAAPASCYVAHSTWTRRYLTL